MRQSFTLCTPFEQGKLWRQSISSQQVEHTLMIILILISILSCHKDPTGTNNHQTQIENGSWTIYSSYHWSHDGYPYNSVYCTVYGDGASNTLKKKASEFSDTKFLEILQLFNFSNQTDFLLPAENNKINVYINKNHQENIAATFWFQVLQFN
jgi:hypothetical protein